MQSMWLFFVVEQLRALNVAAREAAVGVLLNLDVGLGECGVGSEVELQVFYGVSAVEPPLLLESADFQKVVGKS